MNRLISTKTSFVGFDIFGLYADEALQLCDSERVGFRLYLLLCLKWGNFTVSLLVHRKKTVDVS